MDKNKLIAISVVILVAIFGAYYLMNNNGPKNPNFTVYTNEKYGFSIGYPNDRELRENTGQFEIVRISPEKNNRLDSGIVIYANPPMQEISSVEDIKKFLDRDPRIDKKNNPLYKSAIESLNGAKVVIMTGVNNIAGGQGYQVFTILRDNSILQLSGNDIPEHHEIFSTLRLQ